MPPATTSDDITFLFKSGEKVLCFHGPMIYNAICLDTRYNKNDAVKEYLVHYAGWNKSWDEWVPEARILKHNEQNTVRQKEMKTAQKAKKGRASKGGKPIKSGAKAADSRSEGSVNDPDSRSSTPVLDPRGRGKKRESPTPIDDTSKRRKKPKQESAVENEEVFLHKVEIKVNVPDELKPYLVDDMIQIVDNKKQVAFPAKINVDKILDMYKADRQKKMNPKVEQLLIEIILGLKDYFNKMFQSKLLYKNEREHVKEVLKKSPNSLPTEICGPVHFLRLFFRVGAALGYTALNEKSMSILVNVLQDILKFMADNVGVFFVLDNYT